MKKMDDLRKGFYLWIMLRVIFFLMLCLNLAARQRGEFISFDLLESVSADVLKTQVQQQTGFPGSLLGIAYDVKVFKVKYYTLDYRPDSLTIATGIVAIPENYPCDELGILTFGHGLSVKDWEAPSNNDNAYSLIVKGMGANGFIGAAPDYIHLGPDASPGFQAFMHAETEAAATIDLVRAVRNYCAQNSIGLSGQIFLAGYSQGGHSSLATAGAMQDEHSDEFTVTACASGGGTYDLSGIAADSLLSVTRVTPEPHAMCLIIRSYLEVYRDSLALYGLPTEPAVAFDSIFKSPYDARLEQMLQRDNNSWFQLDSIPIRMIEDSFSNRFRNEPDFIFRKLLSYNDLYNWTPMMPLVLFQSESDIEDPIANTYFTLQQFQSRGAPDVQLQTVSGMTHPQAALPYVLFAKSMFENHRIDCLNTAVAENALPSFELFPNPSSDFIRIRQADFFSATSIRIFDSQLRVVYQSPTAERQTDVSRLPRGNYLVELKSKTGAAYRMFVRH